MNEPFDPPADLDPECLALCTALNKLPGITTTSSCCGHEIVAYRIFFQADKLECLPALCYYFERLNSGITGWRVSLLLADASRTTFVVEGPKEAMVGGPLLGKVCAEADKIAKLIEDNLSMLCALTASNLAKVRII